MNCLPSIPVSTATPASLLTNYPNTNEWSEKDGT